MQPIGIRPPLWNRDFIILIAANLLFFFGFQVLLPTLPQYALDLGGNETAAGLVLGLFSASAIFVRPAAGWALDVYGRRGLLLAGLLVCLLTAVAYEYAAGVAALLALRLVHGIGFGVATTANGTLASDLIPRSRLGEGMGYFALTVSLTLAAAPLVGLTLIEDGSFSDLFLVSAVVTAVSLALVWFIRFPQPHLRAPGRPSLSAFVERSTLTPTLVMLLLAFTYGPILGFVALYAEQRGMEGGGGLFFTTYAVTLTAVRSFSGRLSDRLGFGAVIALGLFLVAVGLLLLGLSKELSTFLAAAVAYGLGFGVAQPSLQAATVDAVTPDRRGAATAQYFSAFDLGIGGGAIVGGFIAHQLGYGIVYLFALVPAVLSLLVQLWQLRRSPD